MVSSRAKIVCPLHASRATFFCCRVTFFFIRQTIAGAPSSPGSFIARQAGVPGERLLLAGVERGVSFAVANDRLSFLSRALSL